MGDAARVLPSCLDHEADFALTPDEKRALIVALAERGEAALDEFLAGKAREPRFVRALARLRDRLVREAQRLRERLDAGHAGRRARVLAQFRGGEAEREAERREAERLLDRLRGPSDAWDRAFADVDLVRILERSPRVADLRGVRGVVARWRRGWRRLLAWLARLWRALLRLFGVRPRARSRATRTAVVPLGAARLAGLDVRLHEALLTDPSLRRELRRRLRMAPPGERVRRLWDRLLGRTDYERLAMELMEEEARAKVSEEEARRAREREATQRRLDELRRAEEEAARARDEELERLEAERAGEARRLEERARAAPPEALRDEVVRDLEASGLVERRGEALLPTARLLDRFAEMVFVSEVRALPSRRGAQVGTAPMGEGLFTKEPLRSHVERSHADLVESLVNARLRHPGVRHLTEQDLVVYRETRAPFTHVVIVFDKSGSMEENDRMLAAKKAVFALMAAVKRDARENQVDLVAMDTEVRLVDLVAAWKAEPSGFTNTGAALRLAHQRLVRSKGDRRLVFLVTDGLPEAYTTPDGVDVAGRPEKALAFALEQARRLRGLPGLGFVQLLLEPRDPLYVEAAERLAREVGGKVLRTDPGDLAKAMLVEYDGLRATRRSELVV